MPQLYMLSWLNQVLTTAVVMFFLYALFVLIFRVPLVKKSDIVDYKLYFFLLVLILFFLAVDEFNNLYIELSFYPTPVLLSGKAPTSGLSPKANVKKSNTGAQDVPNDGGSYDIEDDHVWPADWGDDFYDTYTHIPGANYTIILNNLNKKGLNTAKALEEDNYSGTTNTFFEVGAQTYNPFTGCLDRFWTFCGYPDLAVQNRLLLEKNMLLTSENTTLKVQEVINLARIIELETNLVESLAHNAYQSFIIFFIGSLFFALFIDLVLLNIYYNHYIKR